MAASDSRPIPRKNFAMRVYFPILDADGDLVTGASSLDSEVSLDGAAFADCTSEATEIGSSGNYYLDLTASEMNADAVVVQVKTATSGAKTTVIVMYPEEAGDVRADVVAISGDAVAADNLEAAADGTGYNFGGGSVVAASVTGAVGSVTGNVGGNVTGSVGSVATGGITAGSIAADAIGASELAADAVAEIQSGLATAASIAALNNLSSAQAQAAAAAALAAYDPPTHAEMTAELATADDATLAAIAARPSVADFWNGITATAARFIADHTLRRSWASAAASANGDTLSFRSLLGAVAKLVNRVGISGSTLTVYQDDDTTALGTQAVTSDADAEPITGVNTN